MDLRFQDSDGGRRMTDGASEGETLFDLGKLLTILRRQRWILAAWVAIFVILGIAVLATTPPTYRAVASVLLIGEPERRADQVGTTGSVTAASVDTAEQLLRSRALALRVVEKLDLDRNETFLDQPVSLMSRIVGGAMNAVRGALDALAPTPERVSGPPATEEDRIARRRDAAARRLQQNLFLDSSSRSAAMDIGVELHDPALAAQIANAYTEAYTEDRLETSFDATMRTTEFLKQRLSELETDARRAALAAERFRAESGLVESGDRLMTEDTLGRFSGELSQAQADAARASALVASYDAALARGPEALTGTDIERASLPGDARLGEMEQALSGLMARRAEVARNFGDDHPQVAAIDAQIAGQARRLYAEMERQADVARGQASLADARVASLQNALVPLVDANSEALRAQIEYRLLQQRAESFTRLYEVFLSQFQEADQLRLFPAGQIRVLTPADVPRDAASPSSKRVLALAIVLGLMAGLAHAALREWRDRHLRTGEDVSEGLGVRFLGYLPVLPAGRRVAAPADRVDGDDDGLSADLATPRIEGAPKPLVEYPLAHQHVPQSRYSETLRTIRNAATLAPTGGNRGAILGVTSLTEGEGKSTIAADLAGMISIARGRVLLVDGDPRHAGLSRMLGLGPESDMTDAVVDGADWRDRRATIAGTGVDVIGWSDPRSRMHPTEILSAPAVGEILTEAAGEYAHVVVDLSALGPVVDARELIPHIDQFVMVSRWGSTPRAEMQRMLLDEPELASHLLGIVFNRVDMKRLRQFAGATRTGPEASGTRTA